VTAYWAGIDWSERHHDIAVVDSAGTVVARARVEETPAGVKEILRLLSGLRTSHRHSRKHVPIAIEANKGLLVTALKSAGQTIIPINPTIAARYRGRLNPAQKKKSDRADSAMLANIARTDGDRLRGLADISPQALAIAALSRAQQRASRTRVFQFHQLRSLLRDFHPAAVSAWAGLPNGLLRAEARAVLSAGPTPPQAARLTQRRPRDILRAAGRTRLVDDQAERLHALFHQKSLRQPPAVEDAMGHEVVAHLAMLNQAIAQADMLTDQLTAAFREHPLAPIYLSFPGVGELIGARLLAEIGDDPTRFADGRGLRAYAGAAPLTWASGTTEAVLFRTVANKWMRSTGHVWAFATLTRSPGCRAHYDRRRARGDRHAAALRHLYGRLLLCLHHCLREYEPYDEGRAFPLGLNDTLVEVPS
jgi:transposase